MISKEDRKLISEGIKATPYLQHLGIELVEIDADKAILKMPFKNELRQPYGLLHGGATASLIDTTTAFAVIAKIGISQKAVTVDLTIHYLRSLVDETSICTAKIVRAGKRLITVSAEVHSESGKQIATALSTYSIV